MGTIKAGNVSFITKLDKELARCSLYMNETHTLEALRDRAMVTPKVSIALEEHLATENQKPA